MAEPVLILVAAAPVGLVGGWLAADVMAGVLFGPDVPVEMPGELWFAVGVAAGGGLAAVALASVGPFADFVRRVDPGGRDAV
ncbi:hypothetical protein ACFQ07_00135, partial [Actinomadura adrarensis]